MWEALADVLQLMTNQACPHAFHQGDAVTQLTQTAQFFQSRTKTRMTVPTYVVCNQDLASFFTSVDRQIPRSISPQGEVVPGQNLTHAPTFHIDHTQKDPKHRVHRGTGRQKQHEDATRQKYSIYLKDIYNMITLITAILMLNYFTVGSTLIKQLRKTPMVSPCSPTLCNLVVSVEEQCWHGTYGQMLCNHQTHTTRLSTSLSCT